MAETLRSRREAQIWVFRWAGIPVDESKLAPLGPDADDPIPPAPMDARMAANVAVVEVGMEGPERLSRDEIASALRRIEACSFLVRAAMKAGLRDSAVRDAACAAVEIERLAEAGSENAAGSLLILRDMLESHGIADEAFATARCTLAEERC